MEIPKINQKGSEDVYDNSFLPVEKIPSTWNITADPDDNIIFVNNQTGRTFEGTIEEFNTLLRG